jgi:hypothetical protein
MGFFGPSLPKRVTDQEMKRIMSALWGKLDRKERADVEQLFHLALNENSRLEKGITREEYERGISWFRENMEKHHLEESDIAYVEEQFEKYLDD